MSFFINKYTHLLKTSNFWPQCLQNEALQHRYSPCKSEKPNFKGEIENNFNKNPNFHSKCFSEWFGQKKLKLYVFEMDIMTNQLKLLFPKKCWFWSWKGSNIWTLLHYQSWAIKTHHCQCIFLYAILIKRPVKGCNFIFLAPDKSIRPIKSNSWQIKREVWENFPLERIMRILTLIEGRSPLRIVRASKGSSEGTVFAHTPMDFLQLLRL